MGVLKPVNGVHGQETAKWASLMMRLLHRMGTYYLKAETTVGGTRTLEQIDFSINKSIGSVLTFSIDVRTGINPFDKLDVSIHGHTDDGGYINSSPQPMNSFYIPPEAANGWITIIGTSTFSTADWQELDTLHLAIRFSKTNWVSGELLQGFLDNVNLIQTPEPATIALMLIGFGMMKKVKRY